MKTELNYRVNEFLETGTDLYTLEAIITDLVKDSSDEALRLLIKMAGDDYGGITHKWEMQSFACMGAIFWHKKGIVALTELALKNQNLRNISNVTNLLSHLASKQLRSYLFYTHYKDRQLFKSGFLEIANDDEIIIASREGLVEIVKIVDKDDMFPMGIAMNFMNPTNQNVHRMLLAAMVIRWFHFNKQGLDNYLKLIHQELEEQVYHEYIQNNEMLLEPFAAQIWSKPKFGAKLIPDFLIRSIDNSYTVVEIEKPTMNIITRGGNLSAEATHAKKQVLDYREWAISNHLYAKTEFPEIWRPFGLVIIGLEEKLSPVQKDQLRKENESTQGSVRIVGFDWLYNRAKASFDNLIKFGFEKNNKTNN